MSQWVWSASTGVLLGAMVFVLVFVPILVWQYRTYGRWSGVRMIGAAATSVYVSALMTYTWLPLPPRDEAWCDLHGVDGLQLRPLAFVDDIREVVEQVGRSGALRSVTVLQVVFNVLLFVPWGVIVRRYLQRGFVFTVVSGLLGSLFIEATQATGLWGIYPCAYRVADVDDLLANTTGALVGALLGPALLFWMPRVEAVAAGRLVARPVSGWRRLSSMLVTAGAVVLGTFVAQVLGRIALLVLGHPVPGELSSRVDTALAVLVVLLVVAVPALLGRGNLGMYVVWLAPRWRGPDGRLTPGSPWQRLARASVLGLPLLVQAVVGESWSDNIVDSFALLSLALVPWTLTHRSLSGWLTGAELVDTRTELTEVPHPAASVAPAATTDG